MDIFSLRKFDTGQIFFSKKLGYDSKLINNPVLVMNDQVARKKYNKDFVGE